MTPPRNPRILLVGYYGFGNIGDEAILAATAAALRRERPRIGITAVSGDPIATAREHAVTAVDWHDPYRIARAAERADLVIVGGGGLFHDYWGVDPGVLLTRRSWGIPHFAGAAVVAALAGRPVMLYGVGVGPLASEEGRRATAGLSAIAGAITVRDEGSAAVLRGIGVDPAKIEVTADPAFLLRPSPGVDPAPGRERPLLGVCLRPWAIGVEPPEWERAVAEGLDRFLAARGGTALFLPFQSAPGAREDDRRVAERVVSRMRERDRAVVSEVPASGAAAAGILSACDVVVGMRLHSLVFALSAGVPPVAVGYDPKVSALMETFGLSRRVIDVRALDPSRLADEIGAAAREGRRPGNDPALAAARAAAARNVSAALTLLDAGSRPFPADAGAAALALAALDNQLRENAAAEKDLAASREFAARATAEHERRMERAGAEYALLSRELAGEKENLRTITGSRVWRVVDGYWSLRRKLSGRPSPGESAASPESGAGEAVSETPEPGEAPPRPPAPPTVPDGRYDLVVLSIIDWDFRFQRPQQIATQFSRHGHRVFYLSTTRFVPPDGPAYLVEEKAPRVYEVVLRAPRALDIYGGRLEAADLAMLVPSLEALAADFAFGDAAVMVEIPFWTALGDALRDRLGWPLVYDCMDEWANFPGFGADVLALENSLVDEADVVVASSKRLVEKLSGSAARLVEARNAVDLEHYARFFRPNALLAGASHPIVGYYGALASWVDVELIEKIARRHPEGTVVLAGGRFDVDLSTLESLPNVRLLGQRPYEEMPELLWNFDACVIPFLVNEITEATNPVKLYEYLSGGKPVVAPDLTELRPFAGVCYLARGHDEFLRLLESALAEAPDDPRRAIRRRVAEENDWSARYAAIDAGIRECFPAVSVVVVTRDGLPLTKACLESLFRETWPRREIVVVDNGSTDGTPEYLRGLEAAEKIRAVFHPENRGFAAGNNAGIRASTGEVVVLLNNDTVVPPGLLGRLVRHLVRNPWIGLLCPTTNFAGNEAKVDPGYADLADLPAAAAARARLHAGVTIPLTVAAMYCVAMRRALIDRVGFLDEAFGVGMFEDDDFSLRVRNAGYDVRCAEDAYVHHVGQGTFRNLSREEYDALWTRNQEYFERKWGVAWTAHRTREGVPTPKSKFGREPS